LSAVARGAKADGYAMAALIVGMSVMAIMMSIALPVWRTAGQREREAELVFRGEQYARAVELYQRKYAGAFPPSLDVLLNEKMLRRRYVDPMTEDGEFQLLYAGQDAGQAGQIGQGPQGQLDQLARAGQTGGLGRGAAPPTARGAFGGGPRGGIMGVTSKSTAVSLREYNGRGRYNEWAFVATQASVQGGAQTGGQRGNRGGPPGQRGAAPPGRGPRGQQPPPGPGQPPRGGLPPFRGRL
jgi:type II secretory pathway pseudopilin PulG